MDFCFTHSLNIPRFPCSAGHASRVHIVPPGRQGGWKIDSAWISLKDQSKEELAWDLWRHGGWFPINYVTDIVAWVWQIRNSLSELASCWPGSLWVIKRVMTCFFFLLPTYVAGRFKSRSCPSGKVGCSCLGGFLYLSVMRRHWIPSASQPWAMYTWDLIHLNDDRHGTDSSSTYASANGGGGSPHKRYS